MPPTPRLPADRFWAKVDKNGPVPEHMPHLGQCWVWTGTVSSGYGRFRSNDFPGFPVLAHRFAWKTLVGEISDGLEVCHHCDNPPCVRADPDPLVSHLFVGTHKQNMEDHALKGRSTKGRRVGAATTAAAKTHCPHGHEYTEGNIYFTKKGHRHCRTCVLEQQRRAQPAATERQRRRRQEQRRRRDLG